MPVCMLTKLQHHCLMFIIQEGRHGVAKKQSGRNAISKSRCKALVGARWRKLLTGHLKSIRLHSAYHWFLVFVPATTSDGSCRNFANSKLKTEKWFQVGSWALELETTVWNAPPDFWLYEGKPVHSGLQPQSPHLLKGVTVCLRGVEGGFARKAHVEARLTLSTSGACEPLGSVAGVFRPPPLSLQPLYHLSKQLCIVNRSGR